MDLKDGRSLKRKKKKKTKRALGTGGCLAVQGRAALSAISLTLHEGQMPANQLLSRTNKLELVLGNGEGSERERGRQGCKTQGEDVKLSFACCYMQGKRQNILLSCS